MRHLFPWSRYSKWLISTGIFLVVALIFVQVSRKKTPKGDKLYGGDFTYSLSEPVSTLFPQETNVLSDLRVISQLFDPLAKQSGSKGAIQNYLADKITLKNNGTTVYIHLKKGVLFHQDDCFAGASQELTSEDVAFTLSFACSKNELNQSSSLLLGKIAGSEQFYKQGSDPSSTMVSGINILNPYALEIKLTKPYNHIKQLLAHPSLGILSKKSWDYYGNALRQHPVGSGPFYFKSQTNNEIKLTKNGDYWGKDELGNPLPFLDEIHILNNPELTDEYDLFSDKKIDLLFDLPANELELAFGTLSEAKKGKNLLHRVHIQKASKINYIAWDASRPPFNNILVRKAFELAVDKDRICNDVLSGDGQAIKHGFIPSSDFYQNPFIPEIQTNISMANELLRKAGYHAGHKFPQTKLYVNAKLGSNSDLWCRDFCRQISENLGISLSVVNVSTQERDRLIKEGKVIFWKAGWVGDYPDAESYLRLFYHGPGKKNNLVKFENPLFDQLYLRSTLTSNYQEKRSLQRACEAIVTRECAIIPVYSEDFFVMINLRVRGFEMNSSGIIDFAKIYLKELKAKY